MEKFANKIPLPYSVVFLILAFGLLGTYGVLFYLITEAFKDYSFYAFIIWNLPVTISIVLCMIFSRYLRDKTIQHFNKMMPVLKDEEIPTLKRHLETTFVRFKHWLVPLLISLCVAVPFQIYSFIISPDPEWRIFYAQSYYETLVAGIVGTINIGVWLFAISTIGYFCACNAAILYRIRNRLKPLSIAEIDKGFIKPLGRQLMTITTSFTFGVGVNLAIGIIAPITWWRVSEIAIFIVITLGLFFMPLYTLHKTMISEKENALLIIREKWWSISTDTEPEKLNALRIREQRIENIATWPFSGEMLLKVVGYIIIPFILFILKNLLT